MKWKFMPLNWSHNSHIKYEPFQINVIYRAWTGTVRVDYKERDAHREVKKKRFQQNEKKQKVHVMLQTQPLCFSLNYKILTGGRTVKMWFCGCFSMAERGEGEKTCPQFCGGTLPDTLGRQLCFTGNARSGWAAMLDLSPSSRNMTWAWMK